VEEKKDSEVRLQEGHRSQVPAVISSNVFYILPRSLLSALFSVGICGVLFNENRSANVAESDHSLLNLSVRKVVRGLNTEAFYQIKYF